MKSAEERQGKLQAGFDPGIQTMSSMSWFLSNSPICLLWYRLPALGLHSSLMQSSRHCPLGL